MSRNWEIFLLIVLFVIPFILINFTVPSAYMDEIFHYNQTLSFHLNNFTYDPKITTPPGLYAIYVFPMMNIYIARGFNALVGIATALVLKRLSGSSLLVLFPVSFFYHFLFYTDSCSTLVILVAWSESRSRRYARSGLLCLSSLLFRQTNIIWSLFIAISSLTKIFPTLKSSNSVVVFQDFLVAVVSNPILILRRLWSFILTALTFVIFVFWNGGVALGDKSNHVLSIHLAQPFYFSAFTMFYLLPLIEFRKLPNLILKKWFTVSILLLITYYSIKNYTYVSEFTLVLPTPSFFLTIAI